MPTESSLPTESLKENARLRCALADGSPDELRACLTEGPLLLALRELPAEGAGEVEPREWTVRFVSSREIEGATWLCAFADAASAAESAPGAVWVALDAGTVMRFAIGAGYAGLLLDPGGAAARLACDELAELVRTPRPEAPRQRALSLGTEPENAVREALERTLKRPYGAACLRVREPRTGKQVQFALTPDGALLMDVPRSELGLDEAERARMLLDDLAGHALEGEAGDPDAFQALFCDGTERAAKATLKVFTWVFGFPPGFQLEIDEAQS